MTPGLDGAPGQLADDAGLLGVLLAQWGYRDGAVDPAAAVRAGHGAVATIDAMLRDLFGIRAALVAELRADEDETAARADAMLAARRDGKP